MKKLLSALLPAVAGLLCAANAQAATIIGDDFQFTTSENGTVLATSNGVAGQAGPDSINAGLSLAVVDWFNATSFELDFFTSGENTDLTFELTDLDFADGGVAHDIVGVDILNAAFGWTVATAFTSNSITIIFPFLDGIQSADGEILEVNVLTRVSGMEPPEVPLPAGAWLFLTGIGAIAARRNLKRT